MHVVLIGSGMLPHYADPLTHLAAYLAAVVHDFEHIGRTNDVGAFVHIVLSIYI